MEPARTNVPFCPILHALGEIGKRRRAFFLADADLALCQSGAMGRFHLASNFVIALLCGFPNQRALPLEFVPIR